MSHIKSRKHHVSASPSRTSLTATLLASLAVGSTAAAAEQPDATASPDEQTTTLDSVDVLGLRIKRYTADQSASPKFTQPLVDTTQTLNIIGSDLFNEQGATTLTEALRNSPGVGTFYAGENGNTTTGDGVYLRGFDTSGSIFVDGVRDLGSISRDVFNVQQIEVTKGPAGTDNGRTAPTGAINLITKQPLLVDRSSATVSLGTDNQKRATADWNKSLGAGSALRISLLAQDSDVPGRDTIENRRWGIAPSLAFGLESATRFYTDALHIRQDNLPDGGVPTIGLPGYSSPDPDRPQIGDAPRVDEENFYGTTHDYDRVEADRLTLRFEHDFSDDLHLRNTTRWASTRQDYLLTSYLASAANLLTPDIGDTSTWTLARSTPTFKDQRNRILTNQTSLTSHLGEGQVTHDLSAGLEFTREELDTWGTGALNGTAWPAANLYDPDPDVEGLVYGRTGASGTGQTDTAAVYLFDTMKVGERWQVNGGVRVDRYHAKFSSVVACGSRGAPVCGDLPVGSIVPGVDADTSDTLFNWKLGALYKPTEDGSIYANYAVSQQPPGGGALELSNAANSANNPVFDQQKARTAEVGTKWNFFDDALLFTAAIYDTEVTNEIVQDPVDLQYFQSGRKRVRGIEISAVGRLTDAWSISTGFTTMDAQVLEGPGVTTDGSRDLAYTPRRAFTTWTTYAFDSGLTVGGGARYAGELKRGTDGAIGTPAATGDYWVFDAVAGYAFNPQFDLRLNIYNLFDRDYVAAINKSGYRYTPGAPRSAMLTANFHF